MSPVLYLPLVVGLAGFTDASRHVALDASMPYAGPIPAKVRAECDLDTNLPKLVAEQAGGRVAIGVDGAPRVFRGRIAEVVDPGNRAWSKPKSLTVEGERVERGRVLATVTARRLTGPGAAESCVVLNDAARLIAGDLARWLAAPTMDARLGD